VVTSSNPGASGKKQAKKQTQTSPADRAKIEELQYKYEAMVQKSEWILTTYNDYITMLKTFYSWRVTILEK
jgi:hypothetical protein